MSIDLPQHVGDIAQADGTPSAEIIDLEQARDRLEEARDREASARMDAAYRRRIIEQAAAIRRYVAEIEWRARTGDSGALDWLDLHKMPPLEDAIAEHAELTELVRSSLTDVTWPG